MIKFLHILIILFLPINLFSSSLKEKYTPNLVFHQSKETLAQIIKTISKEQKGAYLRFGDGDVNLATGQNDMLQNKNQKLQQEMLEAFAINEPNIFKALPLHSKEFGGYEDGMFPGNHENSIDSCIKLIQKIKSHWASEIANLYTPVALHFTATNFPHFCIRFLKFLKQTNHCILVGNKNIPKNIRDLLFGPNCKFIPIPAEQSYTEIDRIEQDCLQKILKTNQYTVIITAMGCSGRVLQKRLWKKLNNIFLFDFGSLLDALCGWNTRVWITLSKFNKDEFIIKLQRPDTKIFYTTALINNKFEHRKKEYLASLDTLFNMGYKPYIVDACTKTKKSFFGKHCNTVFYAGINDYSLRNKGVNEIKSMIEVCKYYQFKDKDMIVKLTGRYKFNSDEFLKLIEDNPQIDGWFSKDHTQQVRSGCFALRYKYLNQFLKNTDLRLMEQRMINFEFLLGQYAEKIRNQGVNIRYVESLNLTANIFGTGQTSLHQW